MSHDWRTKLQEIEAALTSQNERLTMVRETLGDLPSHASIALSQEWKNAFEEAVEPAVTVTPAAKLPPRGAIRV